MKFYLCLLPLLILAGCATNPVTGKSDFALISEQEEVRLGRQFHLQILEQYGVYQDPELQAYVDRVGQSLAALSHRRHLQFTFTVLDSPEINAFALPGGYVYITRGIMAYLDSEAELAGVLGHEIGHVTARHSVRQQSGKMVSDMVSVLITATTGEQGFGDLTQYLGTSIVRGYGREHELEADRLGAQYLHSEGYDPEHMLDVIGVLKDQEVYERELAAREGREPNIYHGVFSTHPRNDDRLKTVVRAARQLSEINYRNDNRAVYHAAIDGITWGPSPNNGILIDNRYIYPPAAFSIQFAPFWKLFNRQQYLDALAPENQSLIRLQLRRRQAGETPSELLRRLMRNDNLAAPGDEDSAAARISVIGSGGDRQPARLIAVTLDETRALTLLGTAEEAEFARVDRATRAAADSLLLLSETDMQNLPIPRLRIIERKAPSFAVLARDSHFGEAGSDRLMLLNRAFPEGDITRLGMVKTVVTR